MASKKSSLIEELQNLEEEKQGCVNALEKLDLFEKKAQSCLYTPKLDFGVYDCFFLEQGDVLAIKEVLTARYKKKLRSVRAKLGKIEIKRVGTVVNKITKN